MIYIEDKLLNLLDLILKIFFGGI